MAGQRLVRTNEEIKRELSDIIRTEVKDPRIADVMISVVAVETTNDLKTSKVYISVLQDDKKDDVMNALNSAHGFIRKEVARRINLRNTPEFIFKLDETIKYGMHMEKVIKEVLKGSEE